MVLTLYDLLQEQNGTLQNTFPKEDLLMLSDESLTRISKVVQILTLEQLQILASIERQGHELSRLVM